MSRREWASGKILLRSIFPVSIEGRFAKGLEIPRDIKTWMDLRCDSMDGNGVDVVACAERAWRCGEIAGFSLSRRYRDFVQVSPVLPRRCFCPLMVFRSLATIPRIGIASMGERGCDFGVADCRSPSLYEELRDRPFEKGQVGGYAPSRSCRASVFPLYSLGVIEWRAGLVCSRLDADKRHWRAKTSTPITSGGRVGRRRVGRESPVPPISHARSWATCYLRLS